MMNRRIPIEDMCKDYYYMGKIEDDDTDVKINYDKHVERYVMLEKALYRLRDEQIISIIDINNLLIINDSELLHEYFVNKISNNTDIDNDVYKNSVTIDEEYFQKIKYTVEKLNDDKYNLFRKLKYDYDELKNFNFFLYNTYYKIEFDWSSGYETCVLYVKEKEPNSNYVYYEEYAIDQCEDKTINDINKYDGKILMGDLSDKIKKAKNIKIIKEEEFNNISDLYFKLNSSKLLCGKKILDL